MKFLVLGCNGMAGHMVSLYLKESGHSVYGFAKTAPRYVDGVSGDAQDKEFVRKLVKNGKYDSIVNCIGILNRAAEENKSLAVYLNAFFPFFLADITSNTDTQVIHMSTDCVFSGKRGSYTESDFRDGESFYDRSKALGELDDEKNVTLRSSIVGPDIKPKGIGLLNWFMQQTGEIEGFTKVMWTGQTTLQLAKTIEMIAKERVYGLYNMVPDKAISKYELLRLFNKYIRSDSVRINPVADVVANKSLKRTKFDFSYIVPDYEVMICELASWMRLHNAMYPHYHM